MHARLGEKLVEEHRVVEAAARGLGDGVLLRVADPDDGVAVLVDDRVELPLGLRAVVL